MNPDIPTGFTPRTALYGHKGLMMAQMNAYSTLKDSSLIEEVWSMTIFGDMFSEYCILSRFQV